jgi:hypothetical protein
MAALIKVDNQKVSSKAMKKQIEKNHYYDKQECKKVK